MCDKQKINQKKNYNSNFESTASKIKIRTVGIVVDQSSKHASQNIKRGDFFCIIDKHYFFLW